MQYLFNTVVLDVDRRQLLRAGREVHVSPKAFSLLLFLIQLRPNAVSKAELMAHLWPETFVSDSTLVSLVADVREAVGDTGRGPTIIRTLHRFGYSFVAELTQEPAEPLQPPVLGWLLGDACRLPLTAGETVLGREGEGVTALPSTSVSRRHAAIVIDRSGAVVRDLGSKNGTYVDSVAVEAAVALRDGARLRLGTIEFTYRAATLGMSTDTV